MPTPTEWEELANTSNCKWVLQNQLLQQAKTILKGGRIYDGTASEPFVGDILFQGDRILEVASSIDDPGAEVIDISGLSISSGFFDAHSHNDWFAIKKEPVKYFEPFVRQGIMRS